SAFPVAKTNSVQKVELNGDLVEITNNFNKTGNLSPFQNTGLLINGEVYTIKTAPNYTGSKIVLGDILQNGEVPHDCFIDEKDKVKWEYLKGAKSIERISSEGHKYKYSEGGMVYPDALDNSSRTII